MDIIVAAIAGGYMLGYALFIIFLLIKELKK